MVHAIPHPPRLSLDFARITAESSAIAVHVALLLLLLAPMQPPPQEAERDNSITILEIARRKPPPPPPLPVEFKEPLPVKVQAPSPVQHKVPPVVAPPLISEDASPVDVAMPDTVSDEPPTDTFDVSAPPQPGAFLQYQYAPPPPYPRDALREGATGTVMLEVLVDVDGTPLQVTVVTSSGHRSLDLAARMQVLKRWHFRPAMRDGRAVQALGRIPVAFALAR